MEEKYLNPDFDQVKATDIKIMPLNWGGPNFCVQGYNHCGPGCGDGLPKGGGAMVNATDSCCRSHDRCYKNNLGVACCDKELVNCVSKHTTLTAAGIRSYFGASAKRCK